MHRRYGHLILLTVFVVLACAYSGFRIFQPSGLPFSVNVVDAQTGVIEPIPGIPLPPALRAGDRIGLAAQPRSTRIAIFAVSPSLRQTYAFVIPRGGERVAVPVTSVDINAGTGMRWYQWAKLCDYVLLSGMALLALWRGRDRAAAGVALWAIATLAGQAINFVPSSGMLELGLFFGAIIFYLLARVGFYIMIESVVGSSLTPRTRTLWRVSFLLLLGVGAIQALGGRLIFVATGWAGFLLPQYGAALTAPYLVPVALLFVSYRRADGIQRLRLRWMLWSSVVFVAAVLIGNTDVLGLLASTLTFPFLIVIAMAGFLYAVLRHRVVDVSFVISRALVYTATTSIIIGIFAAMNSIVEHAALSQGANLFLELVIPLTLGIGFNTLRTRLDYYVSCFLFRHRYRAEAALNEFAQSCAFIDKPGRIMDLTVEEVFKQSSAQGVALYERDNEGYTQVRHRGTQAFPDRVETDDPAFIRLRAGHHAVDLHERASTLGGEGYVFPLSVRGTVIGVLVCGPRPGEQYTADECKLLAHVAHQVGAALHALRVQESMQRLEAKATLVEVLANSTWPPSPEVQAKARELVSAAVPV